MGRQIKGPGENTGVFIWCFCLFLLLQDEPAVEEMGESPGSGPCGVPVNQISFSGLLQPLYPLICG